jgi:hypothetical protein
MAQPHGFKAVRAAVVAALLEGTYQHEARRHVDVKNLLATGEVSAVDLADLLRRSDGAGYTRSPLHGGLNIDCHIIRASGWYVKFYFIDPVTIFISVHR